MPHAHPLQSLTDAELLEKRPCDLDLQIAGSALEPAVAQLHRELDRRKLRLRPHVWLSDEWFSPDGVPGIAAPFYLAHPRLRQLERRQMLELEGGTHRDCMRILRHEAGHAIDNAFKLHARSRYGELFGSWHAPYPESYQPRRDTKRFVIHLEMNYAQAHPAEDFAETFAVWLDPTSDWQNQYASWPAMRKLLYVDGLMSRLAHQTPTVRSRRQTHTMRTLRETLGDYYARRKRSAFLSLPQINDRDLHRVFASHAARKQTLPHRSAAMWVQAHRARLRAGVVRWTGASSLMIDRTIADMVERLRALSLQVGGPDANTLADLTSMLIASTMTFVHDRKHRVVL